MKISLIIMIMIAAAFGCWEEEGECEDRCEDRYDECSYDWLDTDYDSASESARALDRCGDKYEDCLDKCDEGGCG